MDERSPSKSPLHYIGLFFRTINNTIERIQNIFSRITYQIKKPFSNWLEVRRSLMYAEKERQISRIMSQYGDKSLFELDRAYIDHKQYLKKMESQHDVYVTMWKSGPLAIIPFITAIASFIQLIPPQNELFYIFIFGTMIAVGALSAFGCLRSKTNDERIGQNEIIIEEINKNIIERVSAIRADLIKYITTWEQDNDWLFDFKLEKINDSLIERKPHDIKGRVAKLNQQVSKS